MLFAVSKTKTIHGNESLREMQKQFGKHNHRRTAQRQKSGAIFAER